MPRPHSSNILIISAVIQTTRINSLLTAIHTQYTHLQPATETTTPPIIFDLAVPLAGLLLTPFTRPFLARTSTLTTLTVLVTTTTALNLLSLVSDAPWAAVAQISMLAVYRPCYYAAVADYCVKVFGVGRFGRVYGTMGFVAGLAGFWMATLDEVAVEVVNLVLVVLGAVVGGALLGFVWLEKRRGRREMRLGAVERGEGVVAGLC